MRASADVHCHAERSAEETCVSDACQTATVEETETADRTFILKNLSRGIVFKSEHETSFLSHAGKRCGTHMRAATPEQEWAAYARTGAHILHIRTALREVVSIWQNYKFSQYNDRELRGRSGILYA